MSDSSTKSFSSGRRWSVGFDVVLRTAIVLAVIGMVNYLAARYFGRFYLSSQTRIELSERTMYLLKSLTNNVNVTIYFDKEDKLYATIDALLSEYHSVNPRLSVRTVDYVRNPSEAIVIKNKYGLVSSTDKSEKNWVIFECDGRSKIMPGNAFAQYKLDQKPNPDPNDERLLFDQKLVAFNGETICSAMLIAVLNPNPFKAYVLQGHGEHRIDSTDEAGGYLKFASLLQQNYVRPAPLMLLTNDVPPDCNLLVIPGPTDPVPSVEIERIQRYLEHGGRVLAMFNAFGKTTGLEELFKKWGIVVGSSAVSDPQTITGQDVLVMIYNERHPVVSSIVGSKLQLVLPRTITAVKKMDDGPKVEELAFSSGDSKLVNEPTRNPQSYPLIVAAERSAPPGVITESGATRIIVTGDSYFLGNHYIDSPVNRDLGTYMVNWLLDRPALLQGIGPKTATEFRINMTRPQMNTVAWIFLGALPVGVLLLGVMVWFARRS